VANRTYSYESLCSRFLHFCHRNPQLHALDLMLDRPGPFDQLTYPVVRHGQRSFYVASSLGGVTIDPDSRQIVEARALQLVYQLNVSDPRTMPIAIQLLNEMERRLNVRFLFVDYHAFTHSSITHF